MSSVPSGTGKRKESILALTFDTSSILDHQCVEGQGTTAVTETVAAVVGSRSGAPGDGIAGDRLNGSSADGQRSAHPLYDPVTFSRLCGGLQNGRAKARLSCGYASLLCLQPGIRWTKPADICTATTGPAIMP